MATPKRTRSVRPSLRGPWPPYIHRRNPVVQKLNGEHRGEVTVPNLVFASAGGAMVRNRFRQFNIKLPAAQGTGAGGAVRSMTLQQSPRSFSQQTAQALPFPPALFRAVSSSPADVANQRAMHELYDSMFQQLIQAIEFGFNLYRQSAALVDVVINGPVALGGRLVGPKLDDLILSAPSVISWIGAKVAMRDAVARGLHQQWSRVADSASVPGMAWYPAFAAFPGPFTPPTPNVPTPVVVLLRNPSLLATPALKGAMRSCLRGRFDYSDEFFESLSAGFEWAMETWKVTQMVVQALGTGPIPSFAPPYVPVGPVVGGRILPGSHIAS